MRHAFSLEQVCAAYLADPLRIAPCELPWSACDPRVILTILQENKVPLLSLSERQGCLGLLSDAAFQAALRREAEELANLRAEYRTVKEALACQGIADVLLKSVGLPPSFPYKSDNLDVLYRAHDVDRIKATLLGLGYVELRNVEEPHKYLFRKFHAGHSVSAIHVHAHVGWMVSFLDEEVLWQRCEASLDDPLITVPAAEDGLLTALAHYLYEDKRLSLSDLCKCAHCVRQGVDWDEVYRIATWRGWRDGLDVAMLLCAYQERALYGETIVPPQMLQRASSELPAWARTLLERGLGSRGRPAHWVASGAAQTTTTELTATNQRESPDDLSASLEHQAAVDEMPLRIPFLFSKALFYAKLLRDPTRSITRKAKDLAVHTGNGIKLRLHIHSQPAMLVTLSGVDGCGKTTQARALQLAFETCHLKVRYVWSRGGSSRWLGLFTKLGTRQSRATGCQADVGQGKAIHGTHTCEQQMQLEDARSEAKVRTRQERFRSRWLRWAWSWLTSLELVLQYTRRVALPLLFGRVVICDRYVYDTLADWAVYYREGSVENRWAARVLGLLSPHPAIAYWLDVSAEIGQARSLDRLPSAFLAEQRAACQRLAMLYGLRRLDGGRAWEEISDAVVYEVLSVYFADYHTCINRLFLKNPGEWK